MHLVLSPQHSPLLRIHIPNTKISPPQWKAHTLRLPRLQHHLLKSPQLSDRLIRRSRERDIQLRHLCARHIARVGNTTRHGCNRIPEICSAADVSLALGIDMRQRSFVSFSRDVAAERKRGVRESVAELESRRDVVVIEPLVIQQIALGELNHGGFGDGKVLVVGFVLGDCVDEFARGVDGAVEDVGYGVSGGLTECARVQDAGDVGVGDPGVENARTGGGDDYDGVCAVGGNFFNEAVDETCISGCDMGNS